MASQMPRRSTRSKPAPLSAPVKQRQQTITQMDPFRPLFHPTLDEEDMKYEESPSDVLEDQSRRRKRRKIVKDEQCTPVMRVLTKNARPMTVQSAPLLKGVRQEYLLGAGKGIKDQYQEMKPSMLMPPPKTPKSGTKKEIPSSQSPVDTPPSRRSRSYLTNLSRSPLIERSVNVSPRDSEARSIRKWNITKEVSDSMEYDEDEAHSTPTRLSQTARNARHQVASANSSASSVRSPFRLKVRAKELTNDNAEADRKADSLDGDDGRTKVNRADQTAARTVIHDSDDEGDDERGECFNAGAETQAVMSSLNSSSNDTWDQAERGISLESTAATTDDSSQAAGARSRLCDTDFSIGQSRENLTSAIASSQCLSRVARSDSELANAQLLAEMNQSTLLQGALHTGSQLEADWRSSHPGFEASSMTESTPLRSSSTLSGFPPHFLTSPTQPRRYTQGPDSLSSQRLAYIFEGGESPVIAHVRGLDPPIPPSQATTVDTTQRTSRLEIIEIHSSQPTSSSPPLILPDTSSPLVERQYQNDASQRAQEDFEWRASAPPLTESQLLPQSLMMESIISPPTK